MICCLELNSFGGPSTRTIQRRCGFPEPVSVEGTEVRGEEDVDASVLADEQEMGKLEERLVFWIALTGKVIKEGEI